MTTFRERGVHAAEAAIERLSTARTREELHARFESEMTAVRASAAALGADDADTGEYLEGFRDAMHIAGKPTGHA